MKILYILALLLGLAAGAGAPARAQTTATTCGSGRYAADVFAAVTKTTGIVYGQNSVVDYSNNTSTLKTLALDFYEPTDDPAPQRPLIIFAFGGSFVSGQRTDMDDLCQAFALKGYATATIDYRLVAPNSVFTVLFTPALLADEIVRASSDMKAAVRFFRHDAATANTYHIDPSKIIVAGYSAGAITALQTAYIDSDTEDPTFTTAYQNNGGLEGNTDLPAPDQLLPTYNARGLAGTFSLAGGVATLGVVSAGNPPLYSVHGDADQVVPYGYGSVYGTSYKLYGSGAIQPQATSVGILNQLLTLAGGDHAAPRAAASRVAINTAAAAFFQPLVCTAPLPVQLVSFTGELGAGPACAATLAWRTASEVQSQSFEVQASVDGQAYAPLGTVPSQNRPAGAAYTYAAGPLAGTRYFRLKMLDRDGTYTYSPVVTLAATCAPGQLLLAPNPAHNEVQVSGLPAGATRLLLYNATGQRVLEQRATGPASLSLEGLPPGIYLLQAVGESGAARSTARLVKE
ncbi:T9SS type A sorting domain-containing protein [Hymenobacter cheonanensis]|uniref:T9SS type A sorting domain-containing protein n=1 Tax=Hymenobacter sp. CA2-7 TaxID=3063993 RepID=UPI002713F562|nr:T9SS type A sorting domain-containing protein [Hymenobacter sp. CA2-7]MDO7884213.1 T9SS type A sorting domain-containing protein [Hymenobacter sp. CA2-7]